MKWLLLGPMFRTTVSIGDAGMACARRAAQKASATTIVKCLPARSDLNSALLRRRQEIQDHPIDQSRALQLRCVAAAGNHSELKAREVLDRIVHGI